jgi:death-on-curing protein
VHAQQIERYGGLHGVRDAKLVDAALNRARNLWGYNNASDVADLAAMYLVGFAGSQGFNDGNKRTGVACALVFLAINGVSVDRIGPARLLEITMKVATGQAKPDEVSDFFRAELAVE